MRINEFSNKFNISYDTIRYYMKLNLIVPEKREGNYHFNKECEKEMGEILKLKEMNFSLQEIKNIFNFKRIGKLISYQQNSYYQSLYKQKLKEIEDRITELTNAKDALKKEVVNLDRINQDIITTIGIDLSALSLFSCPRCHHELLLSADKVEENQVIEGSLNCVCGESLQIKEGIIYVKSFNENLETFEINHIEEYIKVTNQEFMDKSYQGIEWMKRQLYTEKLTRKVILEPGSGYGHFLRQVYDSLPEDSIYICIDNNPELNKYLKSLLEMTGKKVKIIFITADLTVLPLKKNIVDILIDLTGTSGFSFRNENFLPDLLNRYLKEQATMIATFIIYHKFGSQNIVLEPYRNNFNYNNIRDRLIKLNFALEKEYKSKPEVIEKSMGKYENFAQLGDQIYYYQVKASRWS